MALAVTAIAAFAGSASASIGGPFSPGADHVVFVQNNSTTGNPVFAYDRAPNGTLALAGTYRNGRGRRRPRRIGRSTTSRRKGRSPTTTATGCCTP